MMTRSSKNKGNGSSKYETDLSLDNNLQVTLTILTEIIGTTTLTAFAAQDRKLLQMVQKAGKPTKSISRLGHMTLNE